MKFKANRYIKWLQLEIINACLILRMCFTKILIVADNHFTDRG